MPTSVGRCTSCPACRSHTLHKEGNSILGFYAQGEVETSSESRTERDVNTGTDGGNLVTVQGNGSSSTVSKTQTGNDILGGFTLFETDTDTSTSSKVDTNGPQTTNHSESQIRDTVNAIADELAKL